MNTKYKNIFSIFVSLIFIGANAQNFIDSSGWNPADPATQQGSFNAIGGNDYNAMVNGAGPFGNTVALWETSQGSDYAGFDHTNITLDRTKTYRFAVWFKITGANSGVLAFRLWSNPGNTLLTAAQTTSSSVYYPSGGYVLPSIDQWYLVVNYVKGTGDTNTYAGGVYSADGNPVSGAPATSDGHSFHSSFNSLNFRTMFWNATDPAAKLLAYGPNIVEVAPADNSIDDLFEPGSGPGTGEPLWTANGDDIHYNTGNVGIGTADPGTYRLAVNGNIHAKEVKVDMTGWADYVFADGYRLPSLEEVKKHIEEKGHLINVPSAKEVEANGIGLGEMDRLLLEKIEELTLYIIQQEKRIIALERDGL